MAWSRESIERGIRFTRMAVIIGGKAAETAAASGNFSVARAHGEYEARVLAPDLAYLQELLAKLDDTPARRV
jgi:hypothetical protein